MYVGVSLDWIGERPQSLFHQVLLQVKLPGVSSAGWEGTTDKHFAEICAFTQAVLMIITDGEGSRAGDEILESQYSGYSP